MVGDPIQDHLAIQASTLVSILVSTLAHQATMCIMDTLHKDPLFTLAILVIKVS